MGQVLLLALLVVVVLGNYILRGLASRRQSPPSGGEDRQRPTSPPRPRSRPREAEERPKPVALLPRWPSRRSEELQPTEPVALPSRARSRPAGDAAERAALRRAAHPGSGRPVDLRQAIVLMAILGPCRGVEPDEPSRRSLR